MNLDVSHKTFSLFDACIRKNVECSSNGIPFVIVALFYSKSFSGKLKQLFPIAFLYQKAKEKKVNISI